MRLKELREEKNLTQSELATAIKTSQTNIGRWEKGLNEPTISSIISLCNYFQCSADYLLEREDDFGMIKTKSNLTSQEQKLLTGFAQLDNYEQEKILTDIDFFINTHKKSKMENA